MIDLKKYDFSFIAFTLRVKELIEGAKLYSAGKEIDKHKLGAGKSSTGIRKEREVRKRLETLTPDELNLLINSNLDTQKQIAFLAMCKVHGFIRDFAVDVLREKLQLFDYELTEGEYISFFRRKAELYPDMNDLTETSQDKIKQVTFKIIEQAGIIDSVKTRIIQPQLLDSQTIKVISMDDPQWLKVFLFSDFDIKNMTN